MGLMPGVYRMTLAVPVIFPIMVLMTFSGRALRAENLVEQNGCALLVTEPIYLALEITSLLKKAMITQWE